MKNKKAIIIGAGPAGLTAAFELLKRTDIKPIILEMSKDIGGISKTVNYKGNRIDIGGHRFFSKSDKVMDWWNHILPFEGNDLNIDALTSTESTEKNDKTMLLRQRKSRIFFNRCFFDYPLKLTPATLSKLGIVKTVKIGASYLRSMAFPISREENLEHFFINRFGRELYKTFFKSYTEKVWGVPCDQISASWGTQRIKGLSIVSAVKHFVRSLMPKKSVDLRQKNVETTLIEQFLYPKYGPGQMWEEVARQVTEQGGELKLEFKVDRIIIESHRVIAVEAINKSTGKRERFEGEYFFSTMPIKDLVSSFSVAVPKNIGEISDGLIYRDFITVGLLCDKLKIKDNQQKNPRIGVSDNWIYIQEPDVQVGRLQIFNNWSPYMVADPNKVWIGLEYFCNDTDHLWNMKDEDLKRLGIEEMHKIGIIDQEDVVDGTVLRMEKTYPAYFGTYDRFDDLRDYLDQYSNMFLIGRNGMHRYNNQDHSMLTAITAVDNIIDGITDKANIWNINTEDEYHEKK